MRDDERCGRSKEVNTSYSRILSRSKSSSSSSSSSSIRILRRVLLLDLQPQPFDVKMEIVSAT